MILPSFNSGSNSFHSDRDPRPAARATRESEDRGIASFHDGLGISQDSDIGLRRLGRQAIERCGLSFSDPDRRAHYLARSGGSRWREAYDLDELLLGVDDDLPGQVFRIEGLEGKDRGVGIDLPVAARGRRQVAVAPLDQEPADRFPRDSFSLEGNDTSLRREE